VPDGREDVLMVRVEDAAAITIERAVDFVCAGLPASVTVTVKFEVPVAVGLPEIRPEAAFSVSPAGRLPEVTDHVYGVVPPLALTEFE